MGVGIARVNGYGLAKGDDGVRRAPDFQASQSEIVMNSGIRRLQTGGFGEGCNRLGGSTPAKKLGGGSEQSRNMAGSKRLG